MANDRVLQVSLRMTPATNVDELAGFNRWFPSHFPRGNAASPPRHKAKNATDQTRPDPGKPKNEQEKLIEASQFASCLIYLAKVLENEQVWVHS